MDPAAALALTLAIEVPIVAVASCAGAQPVPVVHAIAAAVVASAATHPVAWWLASHLAPDEVRAGFTLIEAGVALAETIPLAIGLRWSWRRALLLSIACNGASAGIGLLLG